MTAHVTNLLEGFVETAEGQLPVQADTLCVHGDNPAAVEAVQRIRALIPRDPPTDPASPS